MSKRLLSVVPEREIPDSLTEQQDVATTVAELNRVIHEPARLAILTVLSACDSADFIFLRSETGLTAGNLSVQMTRLEEAGFLTVKKVIEKKRTQTTLAITSRGRGELSSYWRSMERLRNQIRMPAKERSQNRSTHGRALHPEKA